MFTGALYRELRTLEAFMLARQAGEQEAAAFRRLHVWRNRQGPMRSAAGRIDARRLNDAFSRLALIDRQGKGQAPGDPWHGLDHLACSLCGR